MLRLHEWNGEIMMKKNEDNEINIAFNSRPNIYTADDFSMKFSNSSTVGFSTKCTNS